MKNIIIAAASIAAFAAPAAALAQSTPAYTIETRSVGEQLTDNASTSSTANTNTTPDSMQATIDANPGLAEALQKNGIMMEDIGNISVLPNNKVVVFKK